VNLLFILNYIFKVPFYNPTNCRNRFYVMLQLHIAACCGYTRVVQFLISENVKLDVVDNESWQPIHCAGYWAQVHFVLHTSCGILSRCDLG